MPSDSMLPLSCKNTHDGWWPEIQLGLCEDMDKQVTELPLARTSHQRSNTCTTHANIAVGKWKMSFLHGLNHLHNDNACSSGALPYYQTGGSFHSVESQQDIDH